MSEEREKLQEALCRYTAETLTYMDKVKIFCERSHNWLLKPETEARRMMDIRDRADNINRRAELQQELAAVLKETLGGLEELDCFLDAVEKLAVTSLHVFTERNQVLHLPEGISPEHVQVVITAARTVCPLLLEFKRDASVFFLPKLQNVEVLSYQLDRYIQTTQNICDKLQKSCCSNFSWQMNTETLVDLSVDLSEDDIQRMLLQINQLSEIRMNQSFRTVFLFQKEPCSDFITEFSKRQTRMLQFLTELEETAVQLDRMNKRAKISSVVGSSVGAVGGVLSIVGLALIPFTAGVSLALTIAGAGMAVTSATNSLVTTFTEMGVNYIQQNKASETFRIFTKDVQSLQNCLVKVIYQPATKIEASEINLDKIQNKARSVCKGIDSMVDAVSAYKLFKSEESLASAGKVAVQEGKALRNIPRVAADIPDIGQAAVKGPRALSKSARAGLIGLNVLFLGMDIIFICKDSISLAKGSETELSQFIRARAALWSSEMDSWKKIHDFLCKGLLASEKNKFFLEMLFYPEGEMKKCTDTEKEISFDEVDEIQKMKEEKSCVIL